MAFHTYRSSIYQARTIYSVSTSTATYALLEDQAVDLTGSDRSNPRVTFVAITPPESLPSMLAQIAGNWSASRPNAAVPGRSVLPAGAGQVHLDGHVYSVGTDWLVRIGNVTQPGGVHKGIVIEAEYLPVHDLPSSLGTQGDSAIVTEFLTGIIPKSSEDQIMAVALTPQQWADVLASGDDLDLDHTKAEEHGNTKHDEDDIYFIPGKDEDDRTAKFTSAGQSRERRSAYLIIRCLQGEGIL